jgi:hypothetical protein
VKTSTELDSTKLGVMGSSACVFAIRSERVDDATEHVGREGAERCRPDAATARELPELVERFAELADDGTVRGRRLVHGFDVLRVKEREAIRLVLELVKLEDELVEAPRRSVIRAS